MLNNNDDIDFNNYDDDGDDDGLMVWCSDNYCHNDRYAADAADAVDDDDNVDGAGYSDNYYANFINS